MAENVLLIVSDRDFVWQGYRAPNRVVKRWIGERKADESHEEAEAFTGDPTLPGTYAPMVGDANLCAVVDLRDAERARGAIGALRAVRPEAAVLVITASGEVQAPNVAVSRRLEWTDALRGDLDAELVQLEAQRHVHELRSFAEGCAYLPIVVHPDPDPDALATALAVRALLRREPDRTPIVTLGDMTRPENRRMAELVNMRVTVVTEAELKKLERMIAVDHQPLYLSDVAENVAVIDHHPTDQRVSWKTCDLRAKYGAASTIVTEYICADDERRIDETLATALLYGIKTDTDSLSRGVSPADVKAYAYLTARADLPLLRKLERPSYQVDSARAYGEALSKMGIDGDIAVAYLGHIAEEDTHILVDVADFCLALEEITWSVAAAVVNDQMTFTLRHLGGTASAGDLAKKLIAGQGNGGGHATMARARVPLVDEWKKLADSNIENGTSELLTRVSNAVEELRVSRLSSHQARPVTARRAATR
jgi:nanoRNase/pAp phosphatase (c-di-AMP/oligoRNAs hydrolase)